MNDSSELDESKTNTPLNLEQRHPSVLALMWICNLLVLVLVFQLLHRFIAALDDQAQDTAFAVLSILFLAWPFFVTKVPRFMTVAYLFMPIFGIWTAFWYSYKDYPDQVFNPSSPLLVNGIWAVGLGAILANSRKLTTSKGIQ